MNLPHTVAVDPGIAWIKDETRLWIRGKAWQGRGSKKKLPHRLPKFKKIIPGLTIENKRTKRPC